jgi:hypothetical protein
VKITRVKSVQAHPVPSRVYEPRGPFPDHLFDEPDIISEYQPEDDEGGSNFSPGATAQNNYNPEKSYRCKTCYGKVFQRELDSHVCE